MEEEDRLRVLLEEEDEDPRFRIPPPADVLVDDKDDDGDRPDEKSLWE